jgi:hypothetical protein
MKSPIFLTISAFTVATFITFTGVAFAQTEIITFDDLVPSLLGPEHNFEGIIPDGYDGLRWDNFGVSDTTENLTPSGYQNAVVSPDNVAFNVKRNPALLSDGSFNFNGSFNLNSAYLTAAWNNGLQVEVQGFVGTALIYDNTYTVNTTGPTLVNFNYLGVDEVNFISSGGTPNPAYAPGGEGTQFAMDNLSITVPEPSAFAYIESAIMLLTFCRLTPIKSELSTGKKHAFRNCINSVFASNQRGAPA